MNPASNPKSERSSPAVAGNPQSPPKPGRPRALDEAKRREICALVTAGCGIEGAARYVGCAASTIRREALRNPQFSEQLRRADVGAELGPLQAIRRAAERYWRAGAWFLERTNPQRFAKQNVLLLKPEQLKHSFQLFTNILLDEARDPELRRRLLRRLNRLSRDLQRETLATRYDPFPRPRRARKRPSPPAPLPPPSNGPPNDDLPDAQQPT
ncbi:MAG: helix-turn-helix domain-containing protein [Planctomycetes bacterium]|nr:helix-turn-helix domain-containing protein [Planctomycetota bacterium]